MFVVVVEDLRSEQTDKYLQNHDRDGKEVRDQNCKGAVVEEEEDNREEEENEEYVKRTGEKMKKKTRRAVGGDDIMRR